MTKRSVKGAGWLNDFSSESRCHLIDCPEGIFRLFYRYSLGRYLTRMFHELLSRDREDGRSTWQPQGVVSEAYLHGTSQAELVLLRYAQDKFPCRRNTRGRQASGS
jgi:hypothetical protein